MIPSDEQPAPVKTNRSGYIAAAVLFAALVAFEIYFVTIPSPLPPQAR
jgi:hypothetical protein